MPTNGKRGQGRDSNPKFRDHSTACYHYTTCLCFFKDTLGRTRTGDPWIKSPMLYPLSYKGILRKRQTKKKKSLFFTLGRTRTGDPWIKSPTLYLLSYEGSRCQFKPPSGSRTDSSEPSGDPPHVCCTPNGNLCGWIGCAGCSLWPGVGWCGTG